MSAPMEMTGMEIRNLGDFMYQLSRLTKTTGVYIDAYGPAHLKVGDVAVAVRWDAPSEQYMTDERIGS